MCHSLPALGQQPGLGSEGSRLFFRKVAEELLPSPREPGLVAAEVLPAAPADRFRGLAAHLGVDRQSQVLPQPQTPGCGLPINAADPRST